MTGHDFSGILPGTRSENSARPECGRPKKKINSVPKFLSRKSRPKGSVTYFSNEMWNAYFKILYISDQMVLLDKGIALGGRGPQQTPVSV